MKSGVSDKDSGYKTLIESFKGLDEDFDIFVGVPGSASGYEDGANQVLVASVNEFGSSDGRIPERSFLRSTVDENAEKYTKLTGDVLAKVVDGKMELDKATARIGLTVVADVQQKIRDIKAPPNAQATIDAKYGVNNPLIDTGQLRQSIVYEVRRGNE